eukprot:RCo033694
MEVSPVMDHQVIVSGVVLSQLAHTCSCSDDCEGLLYGISKDIKKVEKGDQDDMTTELLIHCTEVVSFLAMGAVLSFYTGAGELLPEKLADILTLGRLHAVGWFRFRRNSPHGLSAREMAVCHSLGAVIKNPVFGLLTQSSSDSRATLDLRYSFFKHVRGAARCFSEIPSVCSNFAATTGEEYDDQCQTSGVEIPTDLGGFLSGSSAFQNVTAACAAMEAHYTDVSEKLEVASAEMCLVLAQILEKEASVAKLKRRLSPATATRRRSSVESSGKPPRSSPSPDLC